MANLHIEEVSKKHGITVDQVDLLFRAMSYTWSGIYSDWMACWESESEAYDAYNSEAEMVAEATIDADRIKTFFGAAFPDEDISWVYNNPDGSRRTRVMAMAEDVWGHRKY